MLSESRKSPIEQLKIMSTTTYKNYDNGDEFQIRLKKGLSNEEITEIRKRIPNNNLKEEMAELLKFSRGIKSIGFFDEIDFDDFGEFGFNQLIQFSLTITHDGIGGSWIQEINTKGQWGNIYYIGHDPPVMIKQAKNLTEFLCQIHDYLLNNETSFFSRIMNKIAFDIYSEKGKLLEQEEAVKSPDQLLSAFASNYDKDWFIADLRNAKNGEGFRLEASCDETIRLDEELIWALKKYKYKSFWTRWKETFLKIKSAINDYL